MPCTPNVANGAEHASPSLPKTARLFDVELNYLEQAVQIILRVGIASSLAQTVLAIEAASRP